MNLTGEKVVHKSLGEGTITAFYESTNSFTVEYKEDVRKYYYTVSVFKYDFMRLANPLMQDLLLEILAKAKK